MGGVDPENPYGATLKGIIFFQTAIRHLHVFHNRHLAFPQNLHKHCLNFPGEIKREQGGEVQTRCIMGDEEMEDCSTSTNQWVHFFFCSACDFKIWKKVGPARRLTPPLQKGDWTRWVSLPAEPTFCNVNGSPCFVKKCVKRSLSQGSPF